MFKSLPRSTFLSMDQLFLLLNTSICKKLIIFHCFYSCSYLSQAQPDEWGQDLSSHVFTEAGESIFDESYEVERTEQWEICRMMSLCWRTSLAYIVKQLNCRMCDKAVWNRHHRITVLNIFLLGPKYCPSLRLDNTKTTVMSWIEWRWFSNGIA